LKSRTRVKTLAYETIIANARFFENDIKKVPKMALTVGVATIMDSREVLIIVTGAHKAFALEKCIENGVNHMYTMSAIQFHPRACIACDEDATAELRVRTVKYFKGLEKVHSDMLGKNFTGHPDARDARKDKETKETKETKENSQSSASSSSSSASSSSSSTSSTSKGKK